jgi:hypothetical protein
MNIPVSAAPEKTRVYFSSFLERINDENANMGIAKVTTGQREFKKEPGANLYGSCVQSAIILKVFEKLLSLLKTSSTSVDTT